MLILPLNIDNDKFAIKIDKIKELIPIVEFNEIPSSPDFVKGLINYRGLVCPLIDLSILIKSLASKIYLSTRIIIVELPEFDSIFGLLAEQITETVYVNPDDIKPVGQAISNASFVDSTIILNGKIVQIINPTKIFSDKQSIFKTASAI